MSPTAAAARPISVGIAGSSFQRALSLQKELTSLEPGIQVFLCPTLADFASETSDRAHVTPVPEILVVLQEQPGEAFPRRVRALLSELPLTRLVVSYGPWCDSDGRTRQLWPLACRVPQHLLLHRLRQEMAVVRGDAPPLPMTADREECWERDFVLEVKPIRRELSIMIATSDPAIAEWLRNALLAAGHRVVESSADPADVLLFDMEPWGPAQAAWLPKLRRMSAAIPTVALCGFLRADQERSLRAAGARAVVDRMAPVSELCRILEEATAAPHSNRPHLQIHKDA